MENVKVGFAFCGSFCTLKKSIEALKVLKVQKADIFPIVSESVIKTDTRFGKAKDHIKTIEEICGREAIKTVFEAEPIGPKSLLDIIVIAPCTGNTMAKIANGITDTAVTMAVKAHLRNNKPVLINMATNDGLGASAKNISTLLNTKNIYFVPFGQDDPDAKPKSLIGDFGLIPKALKCALFKEQLQPILLK